MRLTKRKATYSSAHKEKEAATSRWDGLAQVLVPDNHTNLKLFELEDESGAGEGAGAGAWSLEPGVGGVSTGRGNWT